MSILRFFSQQDQILVEYKPYCPTNVEKMYAEIQQCKYSSAMPGIALHYIIKYSLWNTNFNCYIWLWNIYKT